MSRMSRQYTPSPHATAMMRLAFQEGGRKGATPVPPPHMQIPMAVPVPAGEYTDEDPTLEGPASDFPGGPLPEEEEIVPGDPGSVLEVKHLDEIMDAMTGSWTIKPTPVSANRTSNKRGKYDAYAFTVVRRFIPSGHIGKGGQAQSYNVTKVIDIQSKELREIGAQVAGRVQGVSWTAKPLRVNPQILLSWLPELQEHLETLSADEGSSTRVQHEHLSFLISWLTTEYSSTLDTLKSLLAHGEITFDLLWAVYVPRKTILHILCPTTSEPRAVRLVHAEKCQKADPGGGGVTVAFDISGLSVGGDSGSDADNSKYLYRLVMEYLEVDVSAQGAQYGYAGLGTVMDIPGFTGTKKISSLGAYPMQYYEGPGGPEGLKARLIQRAKKWVSLAGGVHHLAYKGVAFIWRAGGGKWVLMKQSVDSRIMIDRQAFAETMPNYDRMSVVTKNLAGRDIDRHVLRADANVLQEKLASVEELTEDELMLAPPNLYGFSLSDKDWLEFAVERVQPFEWNTEAYENLVIPPEQKAVLTTLVEAHSSVSAARVDDFVKGKGMGLVINLYGNPGTGKSLTAEAMSEHLKKPLYVVGAADLGTAAPKVDQALASILKISATWGAVVLIDEADVFLEERSLHHLERNAMVAVFLRHLEYFRGILFMTTNRVRVFDEAFQSRIHVSLRYHDLTAESRRTIWVAFLHKVYGPDVPDGGLTRDELRDLGEKKINGRQIKNVVKTATALATGRQESLSYRHLMQVLDMMDQFDASHSMYN